MRIALLALCLSACVQVKWIPTASTLYGPREAPCDVEVFSTQRPQRPYVELGLVEGSGPNGTLDRILPKMRDIACEVGGDALILQGPQVTTTVTGSLAGDQARLTTAETLHVLGTIVRYR